MKFRLTIFGLGAVLLLASTGQALAATKMNREDFRCDMRRLWADHVTYTRNYLIDALSDLPSKDVTAQRLLKNQTDIGNAIKPYYGDEAGDKLAALLRDHIKIATEVVDAVKTNAPADRKDDAIKRWQANADDIGSFLGSANPKYWPADDMRTMMRQHLDLLTDEVTTFAQKDWNGSISAFDKSNDQIMKMADMLSTGIANQFPDHFKGQAVAAKTKK